MEELLIKKSKFNDFEFNIIHSNNIKILINTIHELIQVIELRIQLNKEEEEKIEVIKNNIDDILIYLS